MNGNQNPGHPNFVNNSVLHNALYTLILTGDTQGQFMGNRFDGVIVHDGSHYDAFFDNITTCTFIATNTDTYQNPPGPLLIYNNLYSGNYGTNFIIQNNMPTAYTNQVQVWGNHSYSILNDNDLSAKSFVDLGNGIGLTNLYLSSNAYNNASIGTLLTNGGNGSGWIGIMASNMWCFKLSNNIVLSNKIF